MSKNQVSEPWPVSPVLVRLHLQATTKNAMRKRELDAAYTRHKHGRSIAISIVMIAAAFCVVVFLVFAA